MARAVVLPPRQHCWIQSDAYDRAAFATLRAEEDGAVYCACDEHRGDFEWEDLSHAAALRAAMEVCR